MQHNKSRDKDHFFKYVTSCTAFQILYRLKVRWSSPYRFTDSFDSTHDIRFPFDPGNPERIKISAETEIIVEPPNPSELENFNQIWKQHLKKLRVFYVSEDSNNLLMWAHYAESHKGVLIKFKCLPEQNSKLGLCDARQVTYSQEVPVVGTREDWIQSHAGGDRIDPEEVASKYLFTKSLDWSYEMEWRLLKYSQGEGSRPFDDYEIAPGEIDSVYFGCNIESEKREIILNLISKRLKHVKVFNAHKMKDRFALTYEQIK